MCHGRKPPSAAMSASPQKPLARCDSLFSISLTLFSLLFALCFDAVLLAIYFVEILSRGNVRRSFFFSCWSFLDRHGVELILEVAGS